jgi:hypothetical protein
MVTISGVTNVGCHVVWVDSFARACIDTTSRARSKQRLTVQGDIQTPRYTLSDQYTEYPFETDQVVHTTSPSIILA